MLVIQALRPDRLIAMARIFVEQTLGSDFVHLTEKELNLPEIVENEVLTFSILMIGLKCIIYGKMLILYVIVYAFFCSTKWSVAS